VHALLHWLAYMTGSLNTAGAPPNYNFWSGFGGDLAIIGALLWAPVVLLRKHNCEVHRCWRIGRHATAAGHQVCRVHNPGGPLTAAAVKDHHRRALRRERAAALPGESAERLYDPGKDGT
jgi:hypothetical protein